MVRLAHRRSGGWLQRFANHLFTINTKTGTNPYARADLNCRTGPDYQLPRSAWIMADRILIALKASRRAGGVLLAAGMALAAAPLAADVKAGVDAWSAGDFDSAVNEWRLPAQNGDADALFNLAQAYRLGRGVEADISRARELYAEAAQKGHVKAADNYGLLLFQQGEQQIAMPLIRAAAERGDPRAQYVLGLAHFNGDYEAKDWVRAYAFLTLAQAAGLPQAGGALAQMDEYIPMEQRQEAQLLARQFDEEAGRQRAAQLAALDLERSDPVPARVAPAPSPSPVTARASASIPAPVQLSAAPSTAPAPRRPAATVASPAASAARQRTGNWRVQLGAFGVPGNADRLWSKLSSNPALAGTAKELIPSGRVTRLLARGYDSQSEAQRACTSLKREGHDCIVTGA
jgi:cell division septation protein DedD